MPHTIDPYTASVINNLLKELASELDLHYEDSDLVAVKPTIERMKAAASLVTDSGFSLPEAYLHILTRFNKTMN